MTSYMGIVKAKHGLLLGGTLKHVSSRFESKEDALRWCENVVNINNVGRRYPDNGEVIESDMPFEIEKHGWTPFTE